ncbi:SDR family NAD(P)-dependent oxidoreductase [Caballeronia sp. LP006]|uniref:SDR family NAD(P)-dependent oxidoreductase n=1 Tax=Caballeronia sp. LP006 TaxID=3038552 RepID=UPI002858ED15|nr:SDR family oxidoreductase [Caballeronia sp. LP006]MDR5829795.1 SDR family NAD(P)-dependent oxidoreductase [Caballeronia sp. LP006]
MSHEFHSLITGASSGIGRATAIQLSSTRSLVLHGRDRARLEETRQLCANPDAHALWVQDLRELDEIESGFVDFVSSRGMRIENYVHCAGAWIIGPLRLLERASAVEVMNVNFMSAMEISRLLVRRKVNDKALRNIVFVSSTASQFGAKGLGVYCASKGALDAYMRALAVELAPSIRVNSILPGAVHTPMTDSIFGNEQVRERMTESYPLGLGRESDIAGMAEFLLSDNARWITGQQLVVDGGRSVNISA